MFNAGIAMMPTPPRITPNPARAQLRAHRCPRCACCVATPMHGAQLTRWRPAYSSALHAPSRAHCDASTCCPELAALLLKHLKCWGSNLKRRRPAAVHLVRCARAAARAAMCCEGTVQPLHEMRAVRSHTDLNAQRVSVATNLSALTLGLQLSNQSRLVRQPLHRCRLHLHGQHPSHHQRLQAAWTCNNETQQLPQHAAALATTGWCCPMGSAHSPACWCAPGAAHPCTCLPQPCDTPQGSSSTAVSRDTCGMQCMDTGAASDHSCHSEPWRSCWLLS